MVTPKIKIFYYGLDYSINDINIYTGFKNIFKNKLKKQTIAKL